MPVYNGANFLEETLLSIAAQDFEDYELIVTDNASTDATEEIVKEHQLNDSRIRYVRNPSNIGAAENYNLGYRLSSGKYVKWSAHDDLLSPNFIGAMVRLLEADASTSIAFGDTVFIDDSSKPTEGGGAVMRENIADDAAERFWSAMTGAGGCFPIFGLFRSDDLARSTLHRAYYGSDRALICELVILGKLRIDPNATFLNRLHAQQSIRIADRAERATWQNGGSSGAPSLERLNLLRHLFEIAGRHSEASGHRLRWNVMRFAGRPIELGRYGIELVQMVSPNVAGRVRPLATRFWQRF